MHRSRMPYPNRPANPRQFYMGSRGPFPGKATIDDKTIKRDIESALFYDSWVNSHDVNVEVDNGVVTLTGTVDSSFEKRAAGDDAWEVPGVQDVRNEIKIKSPK